MPPSSKIIPTSTVKKTVVLSCRPCSGKIIQFATVKRLQNRTWMDPIAALKGKDKHALLTNKYKSVHDDFLHPYLRKWFWIPVTRLIPRWISPNMITLFGAFVYLFAILLWMLKNPNFLVECEPSPEYDTYLPFVSNSSIHYLLAFSIFLYHTLDNVDGLYARNTKQCSSLGVLMDHGIDSYVTIVWIISNLAIIIPSISNHWYSFLTIVVIILGILYEYVSNWRLRYTRVMHFELIDINEFQVITSLMQLFVAIFGCSDSMDYKPFGLVPIGVLIGLLCIFTLSVDSIRAMSELVTKCKVWNDQMFKYELYNIVCLLVCVFIWYRQGMFNQFGVFSVLIFMFYCHFVNTQIIVSGLTGSSQNTVSNRMMTPFIVACAATYVLGDIDQHPTIRLWITLILMCVIGVYDIVWFAGLLKGVANLLQIPLLRSFSVKSE